MLSKPKRRWKNPNGDVLFPMDQQVIGTYGNVELKMTLRHSHGYMFHGYVNGTYTPQPAPAGEIRNQWSMVNFHDPDLLSRHAMLEKMSEDLGFDKRYRHNDMTSRRMKTLKLMYKDLENHMDKLVDDILHHFHQSMRHLKRMNSPYMIYDKHGGMCCCNLCWKSGDVGDLSLVSVDDSFLTPKYCKTCFENYKRAAIKLDKYPNSMNVGWYQYPHAFPPISGAQGRDNFKFVHNTLFEAFEHKRAYHVFKLGLQPEEEYRI